MIAELKAQSHEAASIYRLLKRYWQRGKSKNAVVISKTEIRRMIADFIYAAPPDFSFRIQYINGN